MHADHEYLAAGFVLGGLTPEEDAAAQSLYEADTDFQLEVAAFSETMAALAESDEPVQPSADLDTAILGIPSRTAVDRPARTDSASEAEVSPRPARSGRPRITGLFALAAATLALVAAALGVLLVNQINQMQQVEESLTAEEQRREQMELLLGAPDLSAEHAESAVGGSVTVTYSLDAQMIHIVPHNLPAPSEDQAMQMWLIGEEGPQSLGLMSGDGSEMLAAVELDEGAAFGVTIEPSGGSPQPSDDPIIVADL